MRVRPTWIPNPAVNLILMLVRVYVGLDSLESLPVGAGEEEAEGVAVVERDQVHQRLPQHPHLNEDTLNDVVDVVDIMLLLCLELMAH